MAHLLAWLRRFQSRLRFDGMGYPEDSRSQRPDASSAEGIAPEGTPESTPPDYEELRRKLTWRPETSAERFLSVFMDQNNRCNLKCKMCGFSDARVGAVPKYDMPRWLFDSIASQVFPHTRFLCLSLMTEPFMTRDFADRLESVRRFEVPYSEIITNGTLLNEPKIGKILDAGITRLTFSIDGATAEIFESIRIGARFEDVLGNFRLVQSMREDRRSALPRLRVNHVLSELNIDRFDDFLGLVETIQAEEIGVRTVSRMSNALIQESKDPEFWRKVSRARNQLADFCRRTGIEDSGFLRERSSRIELFTDAGEKITCRCPWEILAIHPDGDVFPCMAWTRPPVGNFASETFEQIWQGNKLAALRREFAQVKPGIDCLNCKIRKDAAAELDDDFFYEKIAKQPAWAKPGDKLDKRLPHH